MDLGIKFRVLRALGMVVNSKNLSGGCASPSICDGISSFRVILKVFPLFCKDPPAEVEKKVLSVEGLHLNDMRYFRR